MLATFSLPPCKPRHIQLISRQPVEDASMSHRCTTLLILFVAALASPALAQDTARIRALAGTGKAGYAGDGGPAAKALLKQPFHCEVDNKGVLYIAESDNHCIRRVELSTGTITTIAGSGKKGYSGDGGPATKATFNEPYAVVVDAYGALYVVDRLNAVVRKVDGKKGVVTTIAGTG